MLATLRRLPVLATAFLLAATAALVLAGNLVWGIVYCQVHESEPVQPWMTVGCIGRSWDLSPREIDELAGLPAPVHGHPFTLSEIARQRGVPVGQVVAEVESALAELRARERHP
ncbi:hypothetical protein Rumeso_04793 [Rubellimicrobium mesophilum DSM 19309]|uniref:Uncharacterized protein n=1 Tax=Rubellimicrobium mesophilum DSM 19309 TaxID=442562 RepID=A0A017HEI0_9RHOB|nr:hypothetical protein [Rubellimicrobium mesophilum]EYD72917.1 hypothetical protein Rumeso_04793 [Rubellimicrobium mesophilum DSM 19309]